MGLIGIDVNDGHIHINNKTFSRSNTANLAVFVGLIEHLILKNALKGVKCSIITTYADQHKAYVNAMLKLANKLDIPWNGLSVKAIDRIQAYLRQIHPRNCL